MALKALGNLSASFSLAIKRKMRIGEATPTKTESSDPVKMSNFSAQNSNPSTGSSKGSFSRKRRMTPLSTKAKKECDADAKVASPTLTHVICKKRSRLTSTTSGIEFATNSGDNVVTDDGNNDDQPEVKCLASPGSRNKAYRLSDFKVIGKIGSGGFGIVYLVSINKESQRRKEGKDVFAMKVIDKRKIRQRKSDWRHLTSEHFVMTHLSEQHPFIVDLFCSFQTRHQLCYVMEFLQGGELFTWLEIKTIFNEDEARFYLSEIYLALEFLHKQSVIFRDLKPENLMLDSAGHVRLIDFGLSKVGLDYDGLKTTRTICGTSAYMAPEVISHSKKSGKGYGLAADWWSFGALAYDIMVGQPPFQSPNKKQTFDLILYGSFVIPPHLTPEARSLTMGLLQRDPTKRLGHPKGGSIRQHEFFSRQPDWWSDIFEKKIQPPIVPVCKSEVDLSNFSLSSTTSSHDDDDDDDDDKENCQARGPKPVVQNRFPKFENFSFVNEKFNS